MLNDMQRKAMFAKRKNLALLYKDDPKEARISDKLAAVLDEGVYTQPTLTYLRPEVKAMTGSKAGGSVVHLHTRRDVPEEYLVDDKGVARFSYVVCQ